MMEGEAVEIFAPTFKYFKPKVARTALKIKSLLKQIEPLRYRYLNFDELIRHQFQALDFCYFWAKPKVKALRRLAEARMKAVGEPPTTGWS
ncbi:hypothetical protein [Pedobacter sp. N23S346]|uniref:hypothetical protein n=1 Tax=Pedobacter sp. N23S346 TaxID=3402750 RepID=UPI003AEF1CC7